MNENFYSYIFVSILKLKKNDRAFNSSEGLFNLKSIMSLLSYERPTTVKKLILLVGILNNDSRCGEEQCTELSSKFSSV